MGMLQEGRNIFINTVVPAASVIAAGNRKRLRKIVAGVVNAGYEWLNKFDAQEANAPKAFAEDKKAQFTTFVAALPPVTIDAIDPQDLLPPGTSEE